MSLYSTSTKGQCTPYINDIVRFVKHNISEPEAQPYVCKKIWMRSDNHRVEERKNHLWKKHFYRRLDNLTRGFYSAPWETYQPMGGDITLDTGELVMKKLSHVLKSKELQKHTHQYHDKQDTMPPVEHPTIKKSVSSESVEASTFSRAGFQDIMDAIRVSRERISVVRAGLPYEAHFRLIENLSKNNEDQQENDMVLMSLTDLQMMVMQSRKVKEVDQVDSSDIRSMSTTPQPRGTSTPIEKGRDIPDRSTTPQHRATPTPIEKGRDIPDRSTTPQHRATPTPIEKGRDIHVRSTTPQAPFTSSPTDKARATSSPVDKVRADSSDICITSTTPQPLATSSPIDKAADMNTNPVCAEEDAMVASPSYCSSTLDSDVPDSNVLRVNSGVTDRKERIRRYHLDYLNCIHNVIVYLRRMQTRDLRSKTPLSRENLRDLLKVTSGNERDSRLAQVRFSRNYNRRMSVDTSISGDTSSLSQDGGRLSLFGTGPAGNTRRRSRVGSMFGGRRKSRMLERDYMKVETWEDLLALDDKLPSEGSPAAMTQNIIFRTLKWGRRSSTIPGESSDDRKVPIWQQVAMEKSASIFTEKKKQDKSEDPAMVVQRVRHNMGKLKHTLQKQTEAELQRLERVKMVMYQFKIQCFDDMLPSSLFQTHCERMQDATHLINTNPDVEVQPSKWYEELQERTHTKIASDDPEINEVLSKIGKFAQMGPKTLTYVKAKICLLVMSLPAYEICKISMQAAIKFVLEKIILSQDDHLHYWLSLRKLPNVLIK